MPVLGATGAATAERGTWAQSASYSPGDAVSWLGLRYLCKTTHTSGTEFDGTKFVKTGRKDYASAHSTGLYLYGSSYVANGGGGASNGYGYPLKVRDRLVPNGLYAERGVSGFNVGDACWRIAYTASGAIGTVLMDAVVNSVSVGVPSTKQINAFTNGLRAFIDFARGGIAANRILHTDAGMVFTGTWSTVTLDASLNSRTYRQSTTLNDSFTVTWTGDAVTIMLMGRDDTANGTAGAAFSVLNGGSTIVTGTLSNQGLLGITNTFGVNHMPVRLSGFGAGSHTVTVKKTDATGSALAVDCAVPPMASPPQVVIVKGVNLPLTGGRPLNNTYLPTFNAIVDTEIAVAFLASPAGAVTTVDPSKGNSWNNGLTFTDLSGLHMNDAGHDIYAGTIVEHLSNLPYRGGYTGASFLDLNPGAT